jgi:transposase
MKETIEAAQIEALPSSALAKGCNYILTLWSRLTRFLEYPKLELSNNLAENAIRPVVLGRKNWIAGIVPGVVSRTLTKDVS